MVCKPRLVKTATSTSAKLKTKNMASFNNNEAREIQQPDSISQNSHK